MTLTNKNIILAVSGSIAAYKAPDIVRRLQDLGAEVRVVLTHQLQVKRYEYFVWLIVKECRLNLIFQCH
jgi:phosphopantothenoylcysteine synthetase/decarboxylase